MNNSYLQWLTRETATRWWHDSANPDELRFALEHGASGVTTNPVLIGSVLKLERSEWQDAVRTIMETCQNADEKAQALIGAIVTFTAKQVQPFFESSHGETGYVCAQINPAQAGDRDAMVKMARRFHLLAPNIAVKFPATSAGLDAMVTCVADVIQRLEQVPEFRKAYEPDGMQADEFITFGVVQRTLSQFTETGWKSIADYQHSS